MARPSKYSLKLRERAVRMVHEHRGSTRRSGRRPIGRGEDRLHCGDAASVGAAGRARPRAATRSDERRARAVEGARARNRGAEARERDSAEGVGVFRTGGARPPTEVMVAFIDDQREDVRGRADLRAAADRPVDVLRHKAEQRIRRGGRRERSAMRCCARDRRVWRRTSGLRAAKVWRQLGREGSRRALHACVA